MPPVRKQPRKKPSKNKHGTAKERPLPPPLPPPGPQAGDPSEGGRWVRFTGRELGDDDESGSHNILDVSLLHDEPEDVTRQSSVTVQYPDGPLLPVTPILSPARHAGDLVAEDIEEIKGNPSYANSYYVQSMAQQDAPAQPSAPFDTMATQQLSNDMRNAYSLPPSGGFQTPMVVNIDVGGVNGSRDQRPDDQSQHGQSSSSVFRYEFPDAANVVRKILNDSNLPTYRLEERFVLLLTFAVTRGIMCSASDFAFPQLFIDMINLWNEQESDGFRMIMSALQTNTLAASPLTPAHEEKKEVGPSTSEQPDVDLPGPDPDLPSTQEYEDDTKQIDDVFGELPPLNEAADDLVENTSPRLLTPQLSNDANEVSGRLLTEEQNLDVAVAQFQDPRTVRRPYEDDADEGDAEEASSVPPEDDDIQEISLQPGHQAVVDGTRESLRNTRDALVDIKQAHDDAERDFLDVDQEEDSSERNDDHTANVTQRFEATPSSHRRSRTTRSGVPSVPVVPVDSDEEPIAVPRRGRRERGPRSNGGVPSAASLPLQQEEGEEEGGGERGSIQPNSTQSGNRQRAYNSLRVDDHSAWATRAKQRADYWTRRLASMKDEGVITDDDWDGTPITADQWNNRRGSQVLRDLFKRDRLVEYQAYRRDVQRQINERDATQIRDNVSVPPFDHKGKRGGRGQKRGSKFGTQPTPTTAYKKAPVKLDEIIDFGASSPKASARQIMAQMTMTKLTKRGRGLLQKQYHVFIVSPRSVAWVNGDSGSAHYLSTITARIALMTFLFLANPKYGDALRPGLSELVYQLGFEDIFNLFRFQPQYIPRKYVDLFTGKDTVVTGSTVRWNKTGQPRRFASFVDQWTKRVAQTPEELKIAILILNGLIQLQLVDNLHSSVEMGGRVKTAPPAFNDDGVSGTVSLVSNLGIDVGDILTLQTDIKATFHENIDYFMSHAAHRLYARQDS